MCWSDERTRKWSLAISVGTTLILLTGLIMRIWQPPFASTEQDCHNNYLQTNECSQLCKCRLCEGSNSCMLETSNGCINSTLLLTQHDACQAYDNGRIAAIVFILMIACVCCLVPPLIYRYSDYKKARGMTTTIELEQVPSDRK